MPGAKKAKGSGHHHYKGKSSEHFLDKKAILDALSISPGQTILDAGCGNGYMSKEFAMVMDGNGKVYALDPDEESIEKLKEVTTGGIIEPLIGDITKKTVLMDASIDLIYLSNVAHGFSEDQMNGFGHEVKRLLKLGGRLGIVEFHKRKTDHGPPLEIRLSSDDLKSRIPLVPGKLVDIGEEFYLQMFEKVGEKMSQ